MGNKIRFEVFKRDNFTCQYCGRKVPEVVLEVDHIIPKAEGGKDEIQNLITSCFECNRGKGRHPLDKTKVRKDLKEDVYLLGEKELQLKEYYRLLKMSEKRVECDLKELGNYFFDNEEYVFGGNWVRSIKYFLNIFTKDKIKEAIDIAWRRFPYTDADLKRFRYVCGVLHNWRKNNGK